MGMTTLGGIVCAQTVTKSLTAAAVEVTDGVLATVSIPGDATVLDVILSVTDMDEGSALAIDVGDAAGPETPDDNRFIAAFSGQAAGNHSAAASGNLLEDKTYTYSTTGEQEIQATIETVAATGAAGTLTLTVIYFRNG